MSFLVGYKPVLEELQKENPGLDRVYLLKTKANLLPLLELCRQKKVKYKFVSNLELNKIYSGNHQGIIGRLKTVNFLNLEELVLKKTPLSLILALDCIQDPQNLGSLIRTVVALGGQGIVIPKDRTAFLGPGVEKSSAGALHQANVSQVVNLSRALDLLKASGYTIYASVVKQGQSLFERPLNLPAVLVLGNEQKGIRPNVLKRAEHLITIPMPGRFESLNVAQAGAICLGEFLRQNLTNIAR